MHPKSGHGLVELYQYLPLMEPACDRINEPVPAHDRESLEPDRHTEVPPLRMFLYPPPRDVLGLRNNRNNNFPNDTLRNTLRDPNKVQHTGQAL